MIDFFLSSIILLLTLSTCYFLGRVTFRLFGLSMKQITFYEFYWTGLSSLTFTLMFIHLFLPIDIIVSLFIYSTIIPLTVYFFVKNHKKFNFSFKVIAILIVLLIWLIAKTYVHPYTHDSTLYHFPAIHWINQSEIVPGLGNLHGRLAFNNSSFLIIAFLNFYPFFNYGYTIFNLSLLIASFITFYSIYKEEETGSPFKIYLLGLASILFYHILNTNGLNSPSPDLTILILQLVSFTFFIKILTEKNEVNLVLAVSLFMVSSLMVAVKLSSLILAAGMCFIVLHRLFQKRNYIPFFCLLSIPFLYFILFSIRGYMLSGAPLYPSSLGYISLEWSVPIHTVREEAKWVYSWARQPQEHYSNVLNSWNWLNTWIPKTIKSSPVNCIYPLFFSILFIIIKVVINPQKFIKNDIIFYIPIIGSILFWFSTAPDIRFANGLFILVFSLSAYLLCTELKQKPKVSFFVIFIVGTPLFIYPVLRFDRFARVNFDGFPTIETTFSHEERTLSGISISIQNEADNKRCFYSPLLSTPVNRFNPYLEALAPNDPIKGFKIRPNEN